MLHSTDHDPQLVVEALMWNFGISSLLNVTFRPNFGARGKLLGLAILSQDWAISFA